jgi:hypothetical protein
MNSRNPQIPNFMKTRPVGAECLRADWQIDGRTERGSNHFSQFCGLKLKLTMNLFTDADGGFLQNFRGGRE